MCDDLQRLIMILRPRLVDSHAALETCLFKLRYRPSFNLKNGILYISVDLFSDCFDWVLELFIVTYPGPENLFLCPDG